MSFLAIPKGEKCLITSIFHVYSPDHMSFLFYGLLKAKINNCLSFKTGNVLLLIRTSHGIAEIAYTSGRICSKFRTALTEYQGIAQQSLLLGFTAQSMLMQHPGSEIKY